MQSLFKRAQSMKNMLNGQEKAIQLGDLTFQDMEISEYGTDLVQANVYNSLLGKTPAIHKEFR